MSNQKQLNELVKRISGQSNVLTIPRVYLDLTGDHISALFLSQCVYWSDKGRGGWFYKSESEWLEELGLSPYQVRRCRKDLELYIETNLRKANGAPTMHYRVKIDVVTDAIVKKLNNPLSTNSIMESEETSQSDCEETQQSLTETTHKIKSETTTTPAAVELEPASPNAFSVYQANIGMLTPAIRDAMIADIADYTEEWVIEALKQSALSEKRTLAYAEGILKRWKREGFKSDWRNKSTGKPKREAPKIDYEKLKKEAAELW